MKAGEHFGSQAAEFAAEQMLKKFDEEGAGPYAVYWVCVPK